MRLSSSLIDECGRPQTTARHFGVAALLCFALGCSSGYKQETAQVRGAVMLDGKPVPGGSVMFIPENGRGAVGRIDGDGCFVLSTYGNADGAIVGRHRVAVFPASGALESDEVPANYVAIPTRYQNNHSSGIEIEVQPDVANVVEIKLTTP